MDVIQYELLKLKWALPDSNRELNKIRRNILIIWPLLNIACYTKTRTR